MPLSAAPIAAYRRYWFPEAIVLLVLIIVTILAFAITDLDITSARWFFHPGEKNPWPVASQPVWLLFYNSAPWVTGSLAIAGTAALIAGLIRKDARKFRIHGLFILLCVALGPGLIVNGILKDHWGRARPRQIVEFGGKHQYTQPLAPADAHGKSFPCGHCSVGYLYGAGWWLWRRRYPKIAVLSLITGLTLGTLLGFGCLAAGGHFLSDNLWSGLIALGIAHVLYYYVLRIPAREDSVATLYPLIEKDRRYRIAAISGAALLGTGIVIAGIVASPHFIDLSHRTYLDNYRVRPENIDIRVDRVDVELVLTDEKTDEIRCSGYIHGFGLPSNRVNALWDYWEQPAPTLQFRVIQRGWFPDIEGVARIELPREKLKKVTIRVNRGDIIVNKGKPDLSTGAVLPILDLRTKEGRIQQ
ncbi:MAG: phosphatase PAP2 family protein [Nitrospirota bacterium]|nr:phosphatase PAP2 family protein [Nitrospirota bacterium]